ncbi:hypothetical protein ARAM_007602 [Aspergillus rambellii]|uniref:Histone-lysine N-methyltransferase Clr4 n=1 Tax=Aspergillus rambellii TaxID=308745 RepID=A0A0F8WQV2_9EURO|nr:hypothetical protein ARAM_007602 [Aspergillus rambellii]
MSLTEPSEMVIDLTQDSDPEDQPRQQQQQQQQQQHEHKKDKFRLFTPSPATEDISTVSVVIPSPSAQLRREIDSAELISDLELTGLSEKYYPTDAHEKRATKGTYPVAKRVRRADIPLRIGRPGPFLTEKDRRPVSQQLCETLQRKLKSINGPTVSVAPGDEKQLALDTSDFEFINEYKLRKGVSPIDREFMAGCNCINKFCDPARCGCLSVEETSDDLIIPYKRAKDDACFLVLSPDFMARTSMIYECNSLCGCDERCWNRVVQRGRTIRLEIFHTGNRGFGTSPPSSSPNTKENMRKKEPSRLIILGIRSPNPIRAGQFIDRYLGEVITRQAADIREEIAHNTKSHSYLFSLDFLTNDDDIYVVDGQNFGAATRFINHSCNPNCRIYAVSRTHGDQRLYDLAFFSLREIPPNTELTFDYNQNWQKEKTNEADPSAVKCLCGEENCRGQLWPNERKKATKG